MVAMSEIQTRFDLFSFHHAPNYMYTTMLYLPLEAEMNVLIARDLKSVERSSRLHGHLLLPREKNLAQGACK